MLPSNMITLKEISKSIGSRTLFENISSTFNPGNRYGLTGPNGCGKSTLLKIIMGTEEATTGSVSLPRKVGFLKQDIEAFKNSGYSAESDAEELLSGMGLDALYFNKKMSEIPLDLQFRVLLCQALFGKPEALLLDEPTNHLDLHSIGWLEKFLMTYTGILIVVSHDRHFLNAVTTHIADIDYDTLIVYPGNYDAMVVAKMSARDQAEMENKSKEKKIAQLKEFVAKFGAGSRASQVQSRVREMHRLQPQEMKKSNIQRHSFKTFSASLATRSWACSSRSRGVYWIFRPKPLRNH